jgi:hypothetical protein
MKRRFATSPGHRIHRSYALWQHKDGRQVRYPGEGSMRTLPVWRLVNTVCVLEPKHSLLSEWRCSYWWACT